MNADTKGPQRIVCLTAETTELAFALGCGDRVVGVTGYAVRPPEARKKPRVAAFSTAHIDRILELRPDFVLGFSDLQADIAAALIRAGATVLITNQRTVDETYAAMRTVAAVLGEPTRGKALITLMRAELELIALEAPSARPRVFFEEWDEPLITGIGWVDDLITLCGGESIFPGLAAAKGAGDRIVTSEQVIARDPEIIVASWCGKKARLERIAARPGWEGVSAVKTGRLHEVKSPDILAPGLSLLHGARQLAAILRAPL